MDSTKQNTATRSQRMRTFVLSVLTLILSAAIAGAVAFFVLDGVSPDMSRVEAATLDTAQGIYTIAADPDRVEVLFFSFPG